MTDLLLVLGAFLAGWWTWAVLSERRGVCRRDKRGGLPPWRE